MALKLVLKWKNPDASADVNLRFKDVFNKGFVTGGTLTPAGGTLEVDVSPFTLVTFDGAVVTSDAVATLPVVDGVLNYLVCRARWRQGLAPTLSIQSLAESAYLADSELDWLHVVGTVDLTLGGPYAAPPASSVSYDLRDVVDPQGRTSWRTPVDTFASLPTGSPNSNRDGDVRLVLDTGSFYFWSDTLGIWDVFDEASVNVHRDQEHSNGVTGMSVLTTLEPNVSGTDLTVAAVPAGSGYTVNGRFLTLPVSTTTITAASVGASRGMIQVGIDELGAVSSSYRVIKSADTLDISYARFIDMSDGHAAGTYTLLFDVATTTLQWAGGVPVSAATGQTIRLRDNAGTQWVDVELNGAAPGGTVSDNYDVNATLKDDDHLLIAHWYWDGSGVLTLGADRRNFGTTGPADINDDFRDTEVTPAWADLRANMVYSGGTVVDLGGLTARIEGPIVAYIEGRRYEVAANYTGVVLTNGVTNYIFVNNAGVLTIQTTAPTTVLNGNFATVAQVATSGGGITSITDTRDPQLFVGSATRNASVVFTADMGRMQWTPGATRDLISFYRDTGVGSFGDTDLQAGDLYLRNASQIVNGNMMLGGTGTSLLAAYNIQSTNGDVIAGQNVTATAGDVTATAGDVVAGGDVTAVSNVTATTGDITATSGDVVAGGDVTAALQAFLGSALLSSNADAEIPRLSTAFRPATGVWTLLWESGPSSGTSWHTRLYMYVPSSGTASFAITTNAAFDNTGLVWNKDYNGTESTRMMVGNLRNNDASAKNAGFSTDYHFGATGFAEASWGRTINEAGGAFSPRTVTARDQVILPGKTGASVPADADDTRIRSDYYTDDTLTSIARTKIFESLPDTAGTSRVGTRLFVSDLGALSFTVNADYNNTTNLWVADLTSVDSIQIVLQHTGSYMFTVLRQAAGPATWVSFSDNSFFVPRVATTDRYLLPSFGVEITAPGTTSNPSRTVGVTNFIGALNQCKAWGYLLMDGSGGFTTQEGMNFTAAIGGGGALLTITFVDPMGTNPAAVITPSVIYNSGARLVLNMGVTTLNSTTMIIQGFYASSTGAASVSPIDFSATAAADLSLSFAVFSRQT